MLIVECEKCSYTFVTDIIQLNKTTLEEIQCRGFKNDVRCDMMFNLVYLRKEIDRGRTTIVYKQTAEQKKLL